MVLHRKANEKGRALIAFLRYVRGALRVVVPSAPAKRFQRLVGRLNQGWLPEEVAAGASREGKLWRDTQGGAILDRLMVGL